ncbi:MAG: class I SAM-dependent methyltransferase [Chloroflexota bacterium]
MPKDTEFWEFYWETRLQEMEDLGKREAILAASRLVRAMGEEPGRPIRLLELGCGNGQIIGALVQAHGELPGMHTSCGIDYSYPAIEQCQRRYPQQMTFLRGDFTDARFMSGLGKFAVLLLVNALHEVFSAAYSPKLGEIDILPAKQRVLQALAEAAARLEPGGYMVLFDGLEPSEDMRRPVQIRFQHGHARRRFDGFAQEYRPFRITFHETGDPLRVQLTQRDFTRYVTKSIFLEKHLWRTERLESYQYFNETEFRTAFDKLGLAVEQLCTSTINEEKWRSEVEIETPGIDFPTEHILIIAHAPG